LIPELLTLLLVVSAVQAQEGQTPEDPLAPYRAPFSVLVDRSIGNTSTPVAFNWRRTTVHAGCTGDFLLELNNFDSARLGAMARLPSSGLIYELGLSYARVWDTESSELLALTPYRQPGRPPRLEIDFNVGIPLAEGVVTARPRFVPALELVLMGYVGLRYSIYPGSFEGLRAREVGVALVSPRLSEAEIENLDDQRLDAMQVDPGRYGLVMGLGDDLYLKQGLFLSPRFMFAVPLFAAINGSELLFWGDLSLVAGVAF
jgi:hypothetical protein